MVNLERMRMAGTRQVALACILATLVAAAAVVWTNRAGDSAGADARDHSFMGVFDDKLPELQKQHGALCGEFVTLEPDGVPVKTGLSQGDVLPAEVNSLISRDGAPSGWFNHNIITSESVKVVATSDTIWRTTSDVRIVIAEAVELIKYKDFGGGHARWEVVDQGILYPCHGDGSPRDIE